MNLNATLFVQIVVFLVFAIFPAKVVWPPLVKVLDERSQRIADSLAAAEKSKQEVASVEQHVQAEIKKADENQRLATVVAPCSGRVYNLAVHTEGGVVTDAQPLLIIVPDGVELEFEVWADNKDIGFIQYGQQAEVKIDTYNFQKFGFMKAEVDEISADAYDDSKDPEHYKKYRLLLKPTDSSINIFGKEATLTPGMSVNAEIIIKEKRIIEFFLDPFRRYTGEALRER